MESSGSSDEEEQIKLQECVLGAPVLLPRADLPNSAPISNRVLPDHHKQFDHKNVRVPEKLQRHIAQHLDKLLSATKFVKVDKPSQNRKTTKKVKIKEKCIVKLLSSCPEPVDIEFKMLEKVARNSVVAKGTKATDITERERQLRAKTVAVTPEYVLNKKETASWAPETKGVLEVLKL